MAKRYGVEPYLGTQKLEMVDAYIQMWANDIEKMDSLEASSSWLDTKSEIEDMMASLSLEENSKSSLYLLGASATGQVSFDDVRQAYMEGWNTLLSQYSEAIVGRSQVELMNLDRMKERFLAQLPAFGTPSEKVSCSTMAANELRQVESKLQQMLSDSKIKGGKMELAKRETTRTMILAEAKSGFRSGRVPTQVNQEIQNLIGRGNSLFEGQVKSIDLFKNEPEALYEEMDRVLRKASLLLRTQESAFSLAGVSKAHSPTYKQFSKAVGATGAIGDGLRVVNTQNMIFKSAPKHVGLDVVNYSNPPQVFPTNQAPPEATVFPRNVYSSVIGVPMVGEPPRFTNPSTVHRDESTMSQFDKFRQNAALFGSKSKHNPSFQHKNAGLMGTSPLAGSGALDKVADSALVQVVIAGGFFYMLTKVVPQFIPKRVVSSSPYARLHRGGVKGYKSKRSDEAEAYLGAAPDEAHPFDQAYLF